MRQVAGTRIESEHTAETTPRPEDSFIQTTLDPLMFRNRIGGYLNPPGFPGGATLRDKFSI